MDGTILIIKRKMMILKDMVIKITGILLIAMPAENHRL
jgi:hypothetical protein